MSRVIADGVSQRLKADHYVGTVSQSAGDPTGAIIEQGSNADGEFTKYADGTMICHFTSGTALTTGTAEGNVFVSSGVNFTFPATFSSVPEVVTSAQRTATVGVWASGVSQSGVSTTGTGLFYVLGSQATSAGRPSYVAVGRWFEAV